MLMNALVVNAQGLPERATQMGDLKSRRLMYLKAALFVAIAAACAILLLLQSPNMRTGLLLGLLAWASARAYYFLFYVIQAYIDEDFKYSGIIACLKHLLANKEKRSKEDSANQ